MGVGVGVGVDVGVGGVGGIGVPPDSGVAVGGPPPSGVAVGPSIVGGGGNVGGATDPRLTCMPSLIIVASPVSNTPLGNSALINGSSASQRYTTCMRTGSPCRLG